MRKKMNKVIQVHSIASDVSKYTKTDLRKEVLEDVEISDTAYFHLSAPPLLFSEAF